MAARVITEVMVKVVVLDVDMGMVIGDTGDPTMDTGDISRVNLSHANNCNSSCDTNFCRD